MGRGTPSRFHVRWAPRKPSQDVQVQELRAQEATTSSTNTQESKRAQRSRFGCLQCKSRHVKCDETFPVCLRCQKRGGICVMEQRKPQWRIEMPLSAYSKAPLLPQKHANEPLMRHWFESASHIMVLDPDNNPLSYSVIDHLFTSPALLHVLQSISAAHKQFFQPTALVTCLEEQGKALSAFRNELCGGTGSAQLKFLTTIILGLLAAWVDNSRAEFGREHLLAARAMLDHVIRDLDISYSFGHYVVGKYIYWDMVCSFLVDPSEQMPLENPVIDSFVSKTKDIFHPTMGYSTESFYLLAEIGRYFRRVVDGAVRDPSLEMIFEERLLGDIAPTQRDSELHLLSDGYRKIGLITIYRIARRWPFQSYSANPGPSPTASEEGPEPTFTQANDTEQLIGDYARMTIEGLSRTPITSSYLNLQSLQLLIAGSELTVHDEPQRDEVRRRYKALISVNRLPVNMWALELLEEIWNLREKGDEITWLELMTSKGWRLMVG